VNELQKSGKLSAEEAQAHPQRSVITRAVGTDPDVDVDGFTIEAEEGDIFLICSDGLTDMVGDEEILELVHRNRDDLQKVVEALVAAANRGGGEDNITAVAFRIVSDAGISLEDTVTMPAITLADGTEPDEETREYGEELREGGTMIVPPGEVPQELAATEDKPVAVARRVRLVLIVLAVIAIAAALIVWRLLR
jgi:protein phosphatase